MTPDLSEILSKLRKERKSFSNEELELCSIIYESADEVVCHLCDKLELFEHEIDSSFQEKVDATKQHFQNIIHLFEEAVTERQKFVHLFPVWETKRKNNVLKLRELSHRMNSDRFKCNVSTITGSSVGVIGGISVASAFVFPPAALVLGIGGGIAAAVGGVVTFGTCVTEISLRRKCINEAKDILSKDKRSFILMADWFKKSQYLIDAIEDIIGFNLAKEIYGNLMDFKEDVQSLFLTKNKESLSLLKELIKKCARPMLTHPAFAPLEIGLYFIPIVITFFFVIILLRKNNSLIFNDIVIGHRAVLGLIKILDLSGDIGLMICNTIGRGAASVGKMQTAVKGVQATANLVSKELTVMTHGAAATGSGVISKATSALLSHGVFAGIGFALDVTNIIISSIDIRHGSISNQALELESAANKLEKEYETLEYIYNKLVSNEK